jgi:hypothetical protein
MTGPETRDFPLAHVLTWMTGETLGTLTFGELRACASWLLGYDIEAWELGLDDVRAAGRAALLAQYPALTDWVGPALSDQTDLLRARGIGRHRIIATLVLYLGNAADAVGTDTLTLRRGTGTRTESTVSTLARAQADADRRMAEDPSWP